MIHEAKAIDLKERMPYWNGIAPRMNLATHTPLQALYKRMIDVAVEEARDMGKDGLPADEAVLAIDWIFRKSDPKTNREMYLMSFEHCCQVLECDYRRLRGNLRVYLGYQTISTAQADAVRLNALLSVPLAGDEVELFEPIRCVPAVDQGTLFGLDLVH